MESNRYIYDAQLKDLNDQMTELGRLCERAIATAAKAFLDSDAALAAAANNISNEIDRKERDIESMCIKLLLKQQPIASDLRNVSAALKMVTDMERIGDQSADIADIAAVASLPEEARLKSIHSMAIAVISMVNESISAFVTRDKDSAERVIRNDDYVDGLFTDIKTSLIDELRNKDDTAEYAVDLIMIAKYLERIGDHAVNIAKWVIFSITGELLGKV